MKSYCGSDLADTYFKFLHLQIYSTLEFYKCSLSTYNSYHIVVDFYDLLFSTQFLFRAIFTQRTPKGSSLSYMGNGTLDCSDTAPGIKPASLTSVH